MAGTGRQTAEQFWDFSLGRYSRPGVAAACLALQDEAGVDVNLLLFCLWCGQEGVTLAAEQLAALDRGVDEWRGTVIKPLRAARRAMKSPPSGFNPVETERVRDALKRIELETERLQQFALAKAAEAADLQSHTGILLEAGRAVARANLSTYLRWLEGTSATLPCERLNQLVLLAVD